MQRLPAACYAHSNDRVIIEYYIPINMTRNYRFPGDWCHITIIIVIIIILLSCSFANTSAEMGKCLNNILK